MSATRADNADLLAISAQVGPIRPETDQKRWQELKRDLVLGLERALVLVAMRGDGPECRPGPDGGVLLAFTDEEAASAWASSQHPAAPPCSFRLATEEPPKSEREGRRLWERLLEPTRAVSVVVNPDGPDGFLITAEELRRTRPRLFGHGGAPEAGSPWLDPASRAPERERLHELSSGLMSRLDRGELGEVHLHDQNRLGSLIAGAELQYLSGRVRLARGQVKAGVFQMMWGAIAYGRFGDPYRCLDGLLATGDTLHGLQGHDEAGGEPTTWVGPALHDLRAELTKMTVGYRDEDRRRYLSP